MSNKIHSLLKGLLVEFCTEMSFFQSSQMFLNQHFAVRIAHFHTSRAQSPESNIFPSRNSHRSLKLHTLSLPPFEPSILWEVQSNQIDTSSSYRSDVIQCGSCPDSSSLNKQNSFGVKPRQTSSVLGPPTLQRTGVAPSGT